MTPTLLDMARKAGFTVCREESTLGEMLESFAKLIIEHEAAKWYPYGSLDEVTRDLKAEVEASNKMHAELLALKVAARQALEVLDWLLKEDPWAKPDVIGVRNALRRGLEQPTDLPPDFINALKFDVAMRDTANEPVAWATAVGSNAHISWGKDRPDYPIRYEVPLYTTPPAAPVQEPVAIPREWRTALRKLAFMARSSGGTAGHDSGLSAACEEAEALLSKPYTTPPEAPEGMEDFLTDLERSRTKYPKNGRMFDGLMGEVDELRRAYAGDGDIRAEAFDVAVCAYRIATEGDAGGNALLDTPPSAPVQEPVGEICGYYERGFDAEKTRYGKLYNQDLPLGIKLYTAPLAAQDLQAELDATNRQVEILSDALAESRREVAAQRQWVGLSEEEIDKLKHLIDWTATWSHGRFAYEVEQLLKEKNA